MDVQRFDMVRVRFQVRNDDDRAASLRPRLEYRPTWGGAFVTVPADDSVARIAFHVGKEWVSAGKAGGTRLGPDSETIPVDGIMSRDTSDEGQVRIPGRHSMGPNPSAALALPPLSYSEVEFSIRPTTDAIYLAGYEFRITDDGTPLTGAVTATLRMGAEPALLASPIQHRGISVGAAQDASGAPFYRLVGPSSGLVAQGQAASDATLTGGEANAGIHGPYGIAADQCAFCHSGHTAKGAYTLVVNEPPKASLCFRCHDSLGTGADSKVEAQYTDPRVPANDPATGSYYRHDALAAGSGHTSASDNEFGGVSNRHSECADCHDPHAATDAAERPDGPGWTASGRLAGRPWRVGRQRSRRAAPADLRVPRRCDGQDHARVPALLQVPLRLHDATDQRSGPPVIVGRGQGRRAQPVQRLVPSDRGARQERDRGDGHQPRRVRRRTSCGTSPRTARSAASTATATPQVRHDATPPAAGSDLAPHAHRRTAADLIAELPRPRPQAAHRAYGSQRLRPVLHVPRGGAVRGRERRRRPDTNFRYHGLHLTGIRQRGPSTAISTPPVPAAATRSAPSATSGSTRTPCGAISATTARRRPAPTRSRQLRSERDRRTR